MQTDPWYEAEGSPAPFGSQWLEEQQAFNFALYSRDATAITLLHFKSGDLADAFLEIPLDHLVNKSGRVWHCKIKAEQLADARFYACRVSGANAPGSGHRFDDQKVLFDPYAQAIHFPGEFSRAAACAPGSNAGRLGFQFDDKSAMVRLA